jgi:AraC-like DNA-binding protein
LDWKNAMTRVADRVRGILRPASGTGKFRHDRLQPSAGLRAIVQHFWSVRWDLRGRAPFTPETLPHPNVHLVFGADGARISGVHTSRFTTVLAGQGGVFGVKFRPGAFRPFFGLSVATLRNRTVGIAEVFGNRGMALERDVSGAQSIRDRAALVEHFLLRDAPAEDVKVGEVGRIVDDIAEDRDIIAVQQVVERWHRPKRSLQALLNEYVGVGPKWVICRYRLHEALERLHARPTISCTQLALELGYFDQAHFIRDFRRLVGCPPAAYARTTARERRGSQHDTTL